MSPAKALAALVVMLCPSAAALAQGGPGVVAPATPGLAGENIIPIHTGTMAYCVSDFGWSDTWLIPDMMVYDPARDALSGDDAVNLRFSVGGVVASGNGWLTPSMDAGALHASYATGSPWRMVVPVDWIGGGPMGTSITRSVITHPVYGLNIQITTSAFGNVMSQTYDITNLGSRPVEDIVLSDYFNYHPNGSILGAASTGIARYLGGALFFTSGTGVPTLSDAVMSGNRPDSAHMVGTPAAVIAALEAGALTGADGPFGPADAAGAIAWPLGTLLPGDSASFTLTKIIPAPATLTPMAPLALALIRRAQRPRPPTPPPHPTAPPPPSHPAGAPGAGCVRGMIRLTAPARMNRVVLLAGFRIVHHR
ncbi:MAG: hypothetical protein IBJ11_11475 [Phycisphaerales bacterium]|nr:hypothetical protein [Phycisphaerales bacterium]